MTDLKVVLKQFQEADAALNAAIRENGNAFVQTLFQSIFDQCPLVNKLATIGSTPYFNDGDVCEHSSEYFSGAFSHYSWGSDPTKKYYDYEDYSTAEEFFTDEHPDDRDEDEEDEDGEDAALVGNVVEAEPIDEDRVNAEAKAAKTMMVEYDTIFERVYGTNYFVTAIRQADGTIEVNEDEYDPGH